MTASPDRATLPTLRLREGVPVLPRPYGRLQVGMDPGRQVLLPDDPGITAFLAALAQGTDEPEDAELIALTSALRRSGLLIDRIDRAQRQRARGETRTRLLGPAAWRHELDGLLSGMGMACVTDAVTADVTVLMSAGEPGRDEVDLVTHPGDPVLMVAAVDARIRVGPFVLPGSTACLRCLDAHLAGADPGRPTPPRVRLGRPVEPSPVLLRHALMRVALELAGWAEGGCPRTWSATSWIDEGLAEEHEEWARHPHCGCAWEELLLHG